MDGALPLRPSGCQVPASASLGTKQNCSHFIRSSFSSAGPYFHRYLTVVAVKIERRMPAAHHFSLRCGNLQPSTAWWSALRSSVPSRLLQPKWSRRSFRRRTPVFVRRRAPTTQISALYSTSLRYCRSDYSYALACPLTRRRDRDVMHVSPPRTAP